MSDVAFEWSDGDPEEFARNLAELEAVVLERLEEAMETAVLIVESTAKKLAPVDTGRLRSSIATEVRRIASDVVEGLVGTNVEYSKYQEYGTSKMDANPFLRPAIETHRGDIIQLFEEAVEDAIEEVS
jgi:HK97 gp10 family phage protein